MLSPIADASHSTTRLLAVHGAYKTPVTPRASYGVRALDTRQTAARLERDGRGAGGEEVVGGEGGGADAGRVRGAGDGVGAAHGAGHADGDGAAHQEEGHRQGRPRPLGADGGGWRGGGVPPAAPAPVPLPRPLRPQPLPQQQGLGLGFPPPRQGVRVRDVRGDGGGGAGVPDRAGRRAGAAVEQGLQHLHPLLRAGRREPRLRRARRRRHRRALRALRPQPLPPLPVALPPAPARLLLHKVGGTAGPAHRHQQYQGGLPMIAKLV